MNTTHVAVIGGGCAGLSAAAALAERGYAVTLFEASAQLGGRARTVVVKNKDLMLLLDNGQHILLGAYHETLALLAKIGVNEKQAFLRLPLQINRLSSAAKSAFSLKSANYLPAPLNVLVGILFCKGLNFSERYAALKFMRYLKNTHYKISSDRPLRQFLIDHEQTVRLIELLWEPLCLAALNTPIDNASSRVFLNILRDTFTGSKKNSDFLLPKLDLSQILAHPLSRYIQSRGGVIRLNQRIRPLQLDNGGFSLETRDGISQFSHAVIAVSPARAGKLLEQLPALSHALEQTQTYHYQPIYTIYLQYPPEAKLPAAMSGLGGTLGQWVFDRGQICGQKGLMAVVVSAEGKHQKLKHDALALSIAHELSHAFPHLPKPLWHKVIAEKRATFSCVPNLARPSNKTAQANLFLAGDYTHPDYPATIEGAIRSGIHCANLIIKSALP